MLWIVRNERETFGFDLNSRRFLDFARNDKNAVSVGNHAASALEVRPFNERPSDSSIGAKSAGKNCAGGNRGKLLRFARRKAANEIGRAEGRFSPEDPRTAHQSPGPGAFRLLQL